MQLGLGTGILAASFPEVRSPKPLGSPSHVPGHCQLLMGARSPIDLRSVEQSISGLTINPTLVPVRDVPTVFVPATFGLSLRPQPIRSSDGGKEEELSGHERSRPLQTTGRKIAGSGGGACTFLSQFLLHHIIFVHGLIEGLGPTSCVSREICCAGRTGSSYEGLRSRNGYSYLSRKPTLGAQSANTSALPRGAPHQVGSRHRCASKIDGPSTGCPDSSSDSEPEHRAWDLGKAGSRSVLKPPPLLQPTVPVQPRLPLLRPPPQSLWFPQGCHLTGCDSSLRHPFRPIHSHV